ncbi:sulfur carrier protein ThiS adenylyltransferase ThiF [Pseudodesulfovibrio cashew]|uniref:Sulfur carrier protein ThiS adenylyltransferase ThiF n=1 Tax=Pseudodesulfovibrio cashew TaxID=2678688 RepID=A0A6I6JIB2_9BACT|nr:sulfur carrier protein ThiS adenylyltransferase ThiF [Pseudodesulfovibrio cashew]QGY40698.1 sulfur carrier protein ThiS adenylyltransferase ThiF [Pseudodesulfovibrio cashew]
MNAAERGMATYLGEDRLRFLQQVVVGIAGAGGLGSNCAMHLVRSGFKRFLLVDFDEVDASNLNRQCFCLDQVGQPKVEALARNMRAVNPDLELELRNERLAEDTMLATFARCDVVVEAMDAPRFKKALVEAFLPTSRLVVTASGIGGAGDADAIVTRRVRDNLYMVGDMETECSDATPPFAPKVTVAAAKQADVVLGHFLRVFEQEGGR